MAQEEWDVVHFPAIVEDDEIWALDSELGQYQQLSSPQGGGMVKVAWFRNYAANERPDKFDRIVRSLDSANKASELSDFRCA